MTPCWIWRGNPDADGYGRIKIDGASRLAHRVVRQMVNDDLDDALVLDHLCLVKMCCRPDHTEQVTRAENTRRAFALIEACPHGHSYTPENTTVRRGWRECKTCNRERARKNYASEADTRTRSIQTNGRATAGAHAT